MADGLDGILAMAAEERRQLGDLLRSEEKLRDIIEFFGGYTLSEGKEKDGIYSWSIVDFNTKLRPSQDGFGFNEMYISYKGRGVLSVIYNLDKDRNRFRYKVESYLDGEWRGMFDRMNGGMAAERIRKYTKQIDEKREALGGFR